MAQYTNSPLFKDHTAYSLRFTRPNVVRLPLFWIVIELRGQFSGQAAAKRRERERERCTTFHRNRGPKKREMGPDKKVPCGTNEQPSSSHPPLLSDAGGGSSLREKGYVRREAAWLPATVVPASNYTIVVVVAKKGERAYSKEEEDTFSPSPFHPSDAPLSFAACFGGAGFDIKQVQLLQTSQVGDKKKRRQPFFPTVDGDFPFSPPLFPVAN